MKLKEMIFLRDLHFGFLPDDCEDEFNDCFDRIGKVCLTLACLSIHLSVCFHFYLSIIAFFDSLSVCTSTCLIFISDFCRMIVRTCLTIALTGLEKYMCLPAHLSIFLSVCLFTFQSVYISVCLFTVCVSVPLPACLIFILDFFRMIVRMSLTIASKGLERYICLPSHLSIYLSVCLFTFLSVCISICLFDSPSVCTFTCLSDLHFGFLLADCEDEFNDCFNRLERYMCLPAHLSIYLSVCLFTFQSVYISVCLFYSLCIYNSACLSDFYFRLLPDDCEDEFND